MNTLRTARATLAAVALSAAIPALAAPQQGSGVAWDIVEGLTTEIGPRPAGSPAEKAAREWGAAKLKELGFQNVRIEDFVTRTWTRGAESATLTAPYTQPLAITALGFSVPTAKAGLKAELVYFPTLAALEAAPEGSLKGKAAFIDHAMRPAQDGSGYGPYGAVRRQGPSVAARKGAAAVVIRSAGTDRHRNPHTGVTVFASDVKPIPAGAVSNPDADLVARIAARGKPLAVDLTLTGAPFPNAPSGNVIADLPGRDPTLPIIVIACHLDSWDLGTGAVDDASGCGIITAAALAAQKDGQALRTIRVLWSGNEEMGVGGGGGGDHYAKVHGTEPHALAMESDFGADRVWQVKFAAAPENKPLVAAVTAALWPMGIVPHEGPADGGADVAAIIKAQDLAVIDLGQDGTHYFDLHHTPDDTLDKVDPAALQQNVDAWTAVLKVVANTPGVIGKAPSSAQ